jgi:hypothetical protein
MIVVHPTGWDCANDFEFVPSSRIAKRIAELKLFVHQRRNSDRIRARISKYRHAAGAFGS